MNEIYHDDCIQVMAHMPDNCVDLILTDIPYGVINRDGGIRNLNKGKADILTFDLDKFVSECYRLTKSTVVIFCAIEQISEIGKYFDSKRKQNKGSMRQLVWSKTNPSPMNGQYMYLSSIENAIWFKKRGGGHLMHTVKKMFFHFLQGGLNYILQRKIINC